MRKGQLFNSKSAFAVLSDGRVEVTYTHVQRPYLSGDTVTTDARIEIFSLVE